MNPFVAGVAILGGIVLGITVLHWLAKRLTHDAVVSERLRAMQEEAALARRQAQAMQKDITNEDVARSLDDGSF